jgi:DmsE family decaheme c-type cytochrome
VFLVSAAVLLLFMVSPADTKSMTGAMEVCGDCHDSSVEAFGSTPHSALDSKDWKLPEGATVSCTACHGDAATHLDEGGGEGTIFNFEGELPGTITDRCMTCHQDTHPRFAATPHAQSGLSCTSCHSIHSGNTSPPNLPLQSGAASLAGVDESSVLCFNCHAEVFTLFEFNERHRLQEGILSCASCHDPHAPPKRANLGGFKQEMCVNCHTDKGGPFVFEHGSVRVEGCVACHSPHGSPNRHQLQHQNVAELCYSCHATVASFHVRDDELRFDLDAQCTNCHAAIHGSNFDLYFLN